MSIFPLPIFPEGSLSQSVVTTVWVGTMVFSLFNLRFGWTYSGLVVPGYLAPLLVVKPYSAVLILLEAALTYAIVYVVSERLSGFGRWCCFFGRDRFFALFLVSVAVRLVVDGWAIPVLCGELFDRYQIPFDYRNNLHSVGLIVVAMSANLFWKPGLRRGLPPLLLITAVTYVLTRYVLMELTNFSIGNLEYMYEDMAADLLASPKAYVILITSATLASRMNLLYGWEFNGILIPSFMTLLWYDPIKLVTSFGEAAIVLVLGRLALRTPWLKRMTVEGARKMILFFTLSFLYKTVIGFLLPVVAPAMKVSDAFGFGYMMSTLMAIKAHDKEILIRLTRATLQLSLGAAVLTAVLGFGLTLLPGLSSWGGALAPTERIEALLLPDARLVEALRSERVALYGKRLPDSVPLPMPGEVDAFARGVQALVACAADGGKVEPGKLYEARLLFYPLRYRVDEVGRRYLLLRETAPQRGWGSYVFDLTSAAGPVLEVPAPLDEAGSLEAGLALFDLLHASALGVAGSGRASNRDGSGDALRSSRLLFQAFHRVLSSRGVLQVRAHASGSPDPAEPQSLLRVRSALPTGMDLAALRRPLAGLSIAWGRSRHPNLQRDATAAPFAELVLSDEDRRHLVALAMPRPLPLAPEVHEERIDAYLLERLVATRGRIADRGTDSYRPATVAELLLFDEEILAPLFRGLSDGLHGAAPTDRAPAEVEAAAAAAGTFDYRLAWVRHSRSKRDYAVLEEAAEGPARRYWGLCVLRFGLASPYVVEVPRPLAEVGALEYGVHLFERLDARALLVAGAHPRANLDGSADPTLFSNRLGLFNLAHQVLLREAGEAPLQVVQVRAAGRRPGAPPFTADVLLATADGATRPESLSERGRGLLRALQEQGLRVGFVDGSPASAGYEVGTLPQAQYLHQTRNKELALLWLAPQLRSDLRLPSEQLVLAAQFHAVGISTTQGDLAQRLLSGPPRTGCDAVPAELRALVERYLANRDVVALDAARRRWGAWRFERLVDLDSQQAFLLLTPPEDRLPLVVHLVSLSDRTPQVHEVEALDRDEVARFVRSRATWLWPRGKK
ncbi:MAG: poly-gamma-glutamate biosynthesis protein PgsC/CapC [Planctomycetes bacterium]|nr:poly-gamma-glutamate biosynthesis protein PgsC/CapC [Planctomycetota bacterium]